MGLQRTKMSSCPAGMRPAVPQTGQMVRAANPTGPSVNESNVELAELAGSFIHEIKNHLSTLGLNLQLLAEDFQEPQSQRERRALERVQRLQGECQRLVGLANDFLRFARVKDLDLQPTSM